MLVDRANNKLDPFLFIAYAVYKIFHRAPLPSYQKTEFMYTKTDERWGLRRLIFTLLGAAFWDVCIQKVWHTRSFQLFVQVIDRHLCTELMCSVCNSIRSLLKVININDNTLGSSILTHIHIHSTHYLSDFCTNMNQSLSYINIFFSFLLKNPQKRKIKYAQGWKVRSEISSN